MLSVILGFLTGLAGPVSQVINKITDLKAQQAASKSNTEIKKIDQEIAEVEAQKSMIIALAGNRLYGAMMAISTGLLVTPAIVILWKLGVWDKVVGSFYGCAGETGGTLDYCYTFRTDEIPTSLTALITATIGFFLATRIVDKLKGN